MTFENGASLIGYHDLEGRPAGKLAMQEANGRFYLYVAHYWGDGAGWCIVDVTDPRAPRYVRWLEGPPNTETFQLQVADGRMITGMEPILPMFGGDPNGPTPQKGIVIWDVSDPEDPVEIGRWDSGAGGTHRNFYAGGRYVHVATALPGCDGSAYGVVDIDDPAHPQLVGSWWWPGQGPGESFSEADLAKGRTGRPLKDVPAIWLHGGPYVADGRAYCPWARAGMVILDVEDVTTPELVSSLSFYPPLGSSIAAHTVVPIPERKLAIVNSEALHEHAQEPLAFAGIVDLSDEQDPILISLFPRPRPPEGYPVRDFAERGGRFGPHNQHQPQGQPCLRQSDDLVFVAYFCAGLQVFDISNPRDPVIVASCIPDDPQERFGPHPRGELVTQMEDVIVDRRGYIFMSEKNSGLYVMALDDESARGRSGAVLG
ncbi:MAG: hypothetical protein JSS99_02910 [Actinobacteria bacterium]|nr:hypothetical protein [Actinomycetota bacterium]